MELLLLIVWAVAFLPAWRATLRRWYEGSFQPDWVDVGMLTLFSAFFAALIGPLVLAFYGARRWATTHGRSVDPDAFVRVVAGESRDKKIKRQEKELREMRDKMERLERETGVI